MRLQRRLGTTLTATAMTLLVGAAPALAHWCTVADKPADSGIQVLFDANSDEPTWISKGVQQRIDHLGFEGFLQTFHGWIGLDFDSDGHADASILLPGAPEGEIPQIAQVSGAECHGVVNIVEYFENCL